MGWLFGWDRRKQLIEHITATYSTDKCSVKWLQEKGVQLPPDAKDEDYRTENVCLTKTFRGVISGVLYSVWEHRVLSKTNEQSVYSQRWLRVDLVKYYKPKADDYMGGWGYKDMDESMGPCEVSCPLKYLDMVPDPGGYATEWRKNVREWHEARKVKYKAQLGEKVKLCRKMTLTNGEEFEWVTVMGHRPFRVQSPSGTPIRGFKKFLITGPYKPLATA